MIIDGRAIANEVKERVAARVASLPVPPRLTILACNPTFETQTFIAKKTALAKAVGIEIDRQDLSTDTTLQAVSEVITESIKTTNGLIIQVPFPQLASTDLFALIPPTHDVDVIQYDATDTDLLPPVVGAIHEISERTNIDWTGKQVVIVGYGRLVGKPAHMYVESRGGEVTVITLDSPDKERILQTADIIILGAGAPGLLTGTLVKEGVVVFDAGTSEEAGVLRGDADPSVATKASLFTPVPGGIGPITVAVLLNNLVTLAERQNRHNSIQSPSA